MLAVHFVHLLGVASLLHVFSLHASTRLHTINPTELVSTIMTSFGMMQDRLMAEQELKDHDSMFRDVCGTAVHYKLAQAIDTAKPLALHCYHGFGANTFSWSYVYKSLAQQLHAQVTKHDMPGFGLTQRPRHTDGYSFDFNGRLGRLVMDAELVAAGVLTPSEQDSQVGPGVSLENLQCVSSKHKAGQREDEPAVSRASIEAAAASRPRQGRRLSYQPIPESSDIHTSPGDVSQHSEIEQNHVASPKIDEPTPESPVSSQSSWDSITRPGSNRWLSDKQAGLAEHAPEDKKQGPCVKRVLMGHSMGAACAAAEVIHHCQVNSTAVHHFVQPFTLGSLNTILRLSACACRALT